MTKIPAVNEIEINRWYVCLIGSSEELCKVRRNYNPIAYTSYEVVCYYTGKCLTVGTMKECQSYIREHILLKR